MKVFTTGQVAKICEVAPRTVSKWFDTGRLKGYRIPGSPDRRIPHAQLVAFLREHGMPLKDIEDAAVAKVLVVTRDAALAEQLRRAFPRETFRLQVAASGFEAGTCATTYLPDCVVVDFSADRIEGLRICTNARTHLGLRDVAVIAVIPDDHVAVAYDRSIVDESFKKPFDPALLAARIKTLVGARKELD